MKGCCFTCKYYPRGRQFVCQHPKVKGKSYFPCDHEPPCATEEEKKKCGCWECGRWRPQEEKERENKNV